jgi:hypothetical protein
MWSNVFFNTKDTKFFTIQLEANFHFQIMTIISEKQTDLFSSWSILALFLPTCDRLRFGSVFLRTTKVSFVESAWFFLSECVPCQELETYTISLSPYIKSNLPAMCTIHHCLQIEILSLPASWVSNLLLFGVYCIIDEGFSVDDKEHFLHWERERKKKKKMMTTSTTHNDY